MASTSVRQHALTSTKCKHENVFVQLNWLDYVQATLWVVNGACTALSMMVLAPPLPNGSMANVSLPVCEKRRLDVRSVDHNKMGWAVCFPCYEKYSVKPTSIRVDGTYSMLSLPNILHIISR
jgi:hypothetical protein